MYVSRLGFATQPGRTHEVEALLKRMRDLIAEAGGSRPRVLRTSFASLGAPDLILEQESADLAALERQVGAVTGDTRFHTLAQEISNLLVHSSKREVYQVID